MKVFRKSGAVDFDLGIDGVGHARKIDRRDPFVDAVEPVRDAAIGDVLADASGDAAQRRILPQVEQPGRLKRAAEHEDLALQHAIGQTPAAGCVGNVERQIAILVLHHKEPHSRPALADACHRRARNRRLNPTQTSAWRKLVSPIF